VKESLQKRWKKLRFAIERRHGTFIEESKLSAEEFNLILEFMHFYPRNSMRPVLGMIKATGAAFYDKHVHFNYEFLGNDIHESQVL
jgi:hypothetical protein